MRSHFSALIASAFALFLFVPNASAVGETLTVKMRTTPMRSAPSFTASVLQAVSYGTHVEVLEETGAWRRVSTPSSGKGWIHTSALSERFLVLKAGQAQYGGVAGSREIATAGKGLSSGGGLTVQSLGFNARVEALYKRANPGGYARIPASGGTSLDPAALVLFLKAGGVNPEDAQ